MTSKSPRSPTPAYRRRKEARPEEILAAGLDEFSERGFSGASMARIAKRASISRATLYLYFENKEALFLAIAEAAMATFTRGAAEKFEIRDDTTEDLLRMLFKQFYRTMTSSKNSALMRILVSEGPKMPELVEAYHTRILTNGRKLLERIIARGIARGEVRSEGPINIPQIIIAPAMFYALHDMVFGRLERIDEEEFAQAHLELVMRGICA